MPRLWLCPREFGTAPQKIPGEILHEFQAAVLLSPFFVAKMTLLWWEVAYMTDSGPKGSAVVQSKASLEELRAEACLAETRRW